MNARVALLSQVVDVFHTVDGPEAALREARERAGGWFDPRVVAALENVAARSGFWEMLASSDLHPAVFDLEPGRYEVPLDDDYLDEIAAAFAQVVDSKSPYTQGHSLRVGLYTDLIAEQLGVDLARRRWLKRGALPHDVGKLGVSNAILDKPGRLEEDEWAAVRQHAVYTESILSRIAAFAESGSVSGAHHERLDGTGYPKGLRGAEICLETRIITVADIFDAITAERPYRGAVPVAKTLEMMAGQVDSAIDPACFDALRAVVARHPDICRL